METFSRYFFIVTSFFVYKAKASLILDEKGNAAKIFKDIQKCLSSKKDSDKKKADNKDFGNLGLDDIKIFETQSLESPNKKKDLAIGICENNKIVLSQIRYLAKNIRTPTHFELMKELQEGCEKEKSTLFASFVPDI